MLVAPPLRWRQGQPPVSAIGSCLSPSCPKQRELSIAVCPCRAYIALLEGDPPPPHSKAGQALAAGEKLPPGLARRYFPKQA